MASWIYSLAAATGGGLQKAKDEILWEISLREILQFRHCQMRGDDAWTVPAASMLPAADQLEILKGAFFDEWDDA